MTLNDLLPWITTLTFIAYCPVLCYLDWRYRDILSHTIWIPLLITNIPIVLTGYATGVYPVSLAYVSFIGAILWMVLGTVTSIILKRPNLNADFFYLGLISLFMILNPITGQPFMLGFSFYLVGMTAASYWYVFADNLIRKHEISFHMDTGLPYLIPISCALVLALVVG